MKGRYIMAPRRKCKLADIDNRDIDLRQYRKKIVDTINSVVPGKNPRVFKDYYSTDILTHKEAVLVGRALAKIEELKVYGKTITIFRLFDGKVYPSESAKQPINKKNKKQPKGGRMR